MAEHPNKRTRDAAGTQETILDAAETVFAEHGFDGARIDVIAAEAGYNKSLIFQYFKDKLNLYTEVLKRTNRSANELRAHVFAPLFEDESLATDGEKFRALLETIARTTFDYLVEHPRVLRILLWEMAEGWQTYRKIEAQLDIQNAERLDAIFRKAQQAGFLRSDFSPLLQLNLITQICQAYLGSLPLYQGILSDEHEIVNDRTKAYLIDFIVAGMTADPKLTNSGGTKS